MKMLLVLLFFPALVSAAPGPVTRSLMDKPASMFDLGMLRLQMLTTEFEQRVGLSWKNDGKREPFNAEVNVSYDPEDDQINVGLTIASSTATEAQMMEGCDMAMRQLSYWLSKFAATSFSSSGGDGGGDWRELDKAMRDIVVMRCYIHAERDSSQGRFWASRVLSEPEMTVGRWALPD